MKLRGLKSWYETLRTCEAHAHKTSSIARYPVRLNRTMHYRSDLASFFFDRVFCPGRAVSVAAPFMFTGG